jgi:hypothetical protein
MTVKWTEYGMWKWPLFVVVWGTGILLVIGAIIGGIYWNETTKDQRGKGNAPVQVADRSAARIINFPHNYHNIAFKCFGGNGIYTHTRVAPPVVIVNDPQCTGEAK